MAKNEITCEKAERRLRELDFSPQDFPACRRYNWTPIDMLEEVNRLLDDGITTERWARRTFEEVHPDLFSDDLILDSEDVKRIRGRNGTEFNGDFKVEYLWKPYLPLNEYTVIFGQSGTGKTYYTALICAYITRGWAFPLDSADNGRRFNGTVLYITGEESFEEVCDRVTKCGGDCSRLFVIDRSESVGLNIKDGFDELSNTVRAYHPKLVVLDPWQTFLGEAVDMNRMNQLRPTLQRIALLAGENNCAIVLISHVNKREQGQDASNAASGSGELINASRSAIKLIEDEEDDNRRIAVHTKSNHSRRGKSLCFRFKDSGEIVFDGTSEITKADLEKAARTRKTPTEVKKSQVESANNKAVLIDALIAEAANTEKCGKRFTYEEIRNAYGNGVFGECQPKKLLDSIAGDLLKQGIYIKTGIDIRRSGRHYNGFYIQKDTSGATATQ